MFSFSQNRITVAIALLLPCAATLWLLTRPTAAIPVTYAALAALAVAIAFIGFKTWKSGQSTGSVGQLIYETEREIDAHRQRPPRS
jgi:ABC-type Na+ efflux pump permease subunit